MFRAGPPPANARCCQLEEIAQTLRTLGENDIVVGALVLNRVLPSVAEGHFMRTLLEQQSEYLEEIKTRFRNQRITHVEQDARDINRWEQLKSFAASLEAAGLT